MKHTKHLLRLSVLALSLAGTHALAQEGAAAGEGGGAGSAPPPTPPARQPAATQQQTAPPQTTTQTTVVPPPGYPAAGTDLEGHLPSSSKARSNINKGDTFDTFDPRSGSGSGGTVRGKGEVLTGKSRAGGIPNMHVVKRGDTLWDLCGQYYRNPWMWPKVWSFNPQVQNPHWIYPGDQVRMRLGGPVQASLRGDFTNRRPMVPANTVFLRHQGYIDDPKKDSWGELVGAREDQMLLSEGNHVYMIMRPKVELRLGQLLTLFRKVRKPARVRGARRPPGSIVAFKGTVKVQQWDPKTRIARGLIVESLDVIERGTKVGPIGRRFDVVPPRRNKVDVVARLLTTVHPQIYMAQHQTVFIDRGSDDGLKSGNRLFIIRRGDSWRRTLRTASEMAKDRVRQDVDESVKIETTPLSGDERKFPEEVVGEIRVLRTRKKSSLAIVTISHREFLPGDRAVARKGY